MLARSGAASSPAFSAIACFGSCSPSSGSFSARWRPARSFGVERHRGRCWWRRWSAAWLAPACSSLRTSSAWRWSARRSARWSRICVFAAGGRDPQCPGGCALCRLRRRWAMYLQRYFIIVGTASAARGRSSSGRMALARGSRRAWRRPRPATSGCLSAGPGARPRMGADGVDRARYCRCARTARLDRRGKGAGCSAQEKIGDNERSAVWQRTVEVT